ncbi:YidC/Oxa1 family membrane protein insertase [Streptomyces sp. BK022]|uniref:membrane protein insertase YidC n=1 Tax=Streptomyces sp. BK022 TaxID=2512123 RepID=UPI00102937F4|nr:membrane protein insertase YidC [Streptomyces sp. BK022]RZU37270.1 YidC/Oxa1 family membrane protein insertase [Streptomyces sp. BK022]
MSVFARLVEQLADLLQPFFHASATAAAIVLFTALVRLATHPLARAAARGQRARTALQPRITELRAKHAGDPERLRRAMLELHTGAKVSPFSGLLPGLLQLPAFFLLYHLFSNATIGDGPNTLLDHDLLAAPLAGHWSDALGGGIFGGADLVYLALFAVVAAVATVNFRRTRRAAAENPVQTGVPGQAAVGKVAPFLSFLTLVTVAVVPLAAALYVVTSTTWSAVERAVLS